MKFPARFIIFWLAGASWTGGGAGCQHAGPAEGGSSSFSFVTPPSRPPPRVQSETEVGQTMENAIPAEPILPLAVPLYPKITPRDRPPLAFVGLRLTIDRSGRVAEVGPSIYALSTPGPFADHFRAAAEAAVAQWRFEPAMLHRFEVQKGNDARLVLAWKGGDVIDWVVEVTFAFRADGLVTSGATPAQKSRAAR